MSLKVTIELPLEVVAALQAATNAHEAKSQANVAEATIRAALDAAHALPYSLQSRTERAHISRSGVDHAARTEQEYSHDIDDATSVVDSESSSARIFTPPPSESSDSAADDTESESSSDVVFTPPPSDSGASTADGTETESTGSTVFTPPPSEPDESTADKDETTPASAQIPTSPSAELPQPQFATLRDLYKSEGTLPDTSSSESSESSSPEDPDEDDRYRPNSLSPPHDPRPPWELPFRPSRTNSRPTNLAGLCAVHLLHMARYHPSVAIRTRILLDQQVIQAEIESRRKRVAGTWRLPAQLIPRKRTSSVSDRSRGRIGNPRPSKVPRRVSPRPVVPRRLAPDSLNPPLEPSRPTLPSLKQSIPEPLLSSDESIHIRQQFILDTIALHNILSHRFSLRHTFPIFVKLLCGKTRTLLVDGCTSVEEVKQRLSQDMPGCLMGLYYRGMRLRGWESLIEAGVGKDSTLHVHVVPCHRAGEHRGHV